MFVANKKRFCGSEHQRISWAGGRWAGCDIIMNTYLVFDVDVGAVVDKQPHDVHVVVN